MCYFCCTFYVSLNRTDLLLPVLELLSHLVQNLDHLNPNLPLLIFFLFFYYLIFVFMVLEIHSSLNGLMFLILTVSRNEPLFNRTVPFEFTCNMTYGPSNIFPAYFPSNLAFNRTFCPGAYLYAILFLFSLSLFFRINFSFLSLMCFQFAWNFPLSTASLPNTSCIGVACRVVCILALVANIAAASTPDQGSSTSSSISFN